MDDRVNIEQLPLSAEPHGEGWDALVETNELINDIWFEVDGDRGLDMTAEGRLASLAPKSHERSVLLVARTAETIVGYALLRQALQDGGRKGKLLVGVASGHRRRGVGGRLGSSGLQAARSLGIATLEAFVAHPETTGPRHAVEGGSGDVPAESASARFALSQGFRLVQANVGSVLALPVDGDRLSTLEAGLPTTREAYDLRLWQEPTPDDLVAGIAVLRTRMSTDAPTGGFDGAEDLWDVERVRASEKVRAAKGTRALMAGAVHRDTGELAAFTELWVPAAPGLPTMQMFTLVLREHRGHGLGTLAKIANLRQLARLSPSTSKVKTYNAEENAPMRRINEALGFRPHSVSGGWRLDL